MPRYRIHRIKDGPKESFRWACHTGGLAIVKPKDYAFTEERDAANPYELWRELRGMAVPLQPGDVLEILPPEDDSSPGQMLIAKYIGFEPAQWFVPQLKLTAAIATAEAGSITEMETERHP